MVAHSLGILKQTRFRYVLFLWVSHVTVQTLKQAGPQEYMKESKQSSNTSPLWPSANLIHTNRQTHTLFATAVQKGVRTIHFDRSLVSKLSKMKQQSLTYSQS